MRKVMALALTCLCLAGCSKKEPAQAPPPTPVTPTTATAPAAPTAPPPAKKETRTPAETPAPAVPAKAAASKLEPRIGFVKADDATQGNWKGVYGKDGFSILGDKENLPPYATLAAEGNQAHQWGADPNERRAPQRAGDGRIVGCWYSNSSMDLQIGLKDGKTHQLALYVLDWDTNQRAQTIEVREAKSYKLVDMQSAKDFTKGRYLVWNVKDAITVHLSCDGGNNAILSAIFFDPPALPGAK